MRPCQLAIAPDSLAIEKQQREISKSKNCAYHRERSPPERHPKFRSEDIRHPDFPGSDRRTVNLSEATNGESHANQDPNFDEGS
jgi:hypothetical protein